MSSLLIKNMPENLHAQLKESARRHRRSMTQEALVILEKYLSMGTAVEFPEPVIPLKPITAALIRKGIREGRS
jgi:plasmid stability protein